MTTQQWLDPALSLLRTYDSCYGSTEKQYPLRSQSGRNEDHGLARISENMYIDKMSVISAWYENRGFGEQCLKISCVTSKTTSSDDILDNFFNAWKQTEFGNQQQIINVNAFRSLGKVVRIRSSFLKKEMTIIKSASYAWKP